MKTTAILGAGSWGTALAVHLARAGHGVRLWARDAAFVDELRATKVNGRYLPDIALADAISPTASLATALTGARFVVVAVPSHGLRAVVRSSLPHLETGAIVVSTDEGNRDQHPAPDVAGD